MEVCQTVEPVPGTPLDPADPRTWWAASRAAHHDGMPVDGQMPDYILALSGVPARRYYTDPRVCALTSAAVSAYYQMDGAPVASELTTTRSRPSAAPCSTARAPCPPSTSPSP